MPFVPLLTLCDQPAADTRNEDATYSKVGLIEVLYTGLKHKSLFLEMNFRVLLSTIKQAHVSLQQSAVKAVNRHITLRNWLIGFYIFEYEQKGEDRAKYGELLLEKLAKKMKIRGLSETNLKLFRKFYVSYSSIGQMWQGF